MNEIEVVQSDTVIRDERYENFRKEIEAAWKEGLKIIINTASRIDFIVGRSIVDFIEQNKVNPTALVRQVAIDLHKSPRSVWSTYMLWKDRPDYEATILEAAEKSGYPEPSLSALRKVFLGEGGQSDFNLDVVVERLLKKYGHEKATQIAQRILILLQGQQTCDTKVCYNVTTLSNTRQQYANTSADTLLSKTGTHE